MKSLLFIHRSVGYYLIRDGEVRRLVADAEPAFSFSDYNQNTDTLTSNEGHEQKPGFTFPGGNTRPEDYAQIFTDNVVLAYKPIQDLALSFDVIAIKSCYPNSNIKNDEQLEAMKQHYLSIVRFFKQHPSKRLVILTSPPLAPLMTTPWRAKRARQLATWLANADLGTNVSVFNFFDLLATPKAGWLRRPYRRWLPIDSHPNARADREIAPVFVEFLDQMLTDK